MIRIGDSSCSPPSSQLVHGIARVEATFPRLAELALGGTAIGTGLNAHPEFGARAAAKLHQVPPLAEVVAQRTTVEIDEIGEIGGIGGIDAAGGTASGAGAAREGEARLVSDLEVLVQGHPQSRLVLPLAGVALAVEVQGAAVTAAGGAARPHAAAAAPATAAAMVDGGGAATPGLYLLAAEPGRYTVHARSRVRFDSVQGESRVTLTPIVAPVAVLEIGLPAGLAWECTGAVVVEDRVEGSRRHLRLSAGRGLEPVLALRRQVAGDEAAALAGPGRRRHPAAAASGRAAPP